MKGGSEQRFTYLFNFYLVLVSSSCISPICLFILGYCAQETILWGPLDLTEQSWRFTGCQTLKRFAYLLHFVSFS